LLHLMTMLTPSGVHLAGWRHPKSWGELTMNLDHAIELAQIAEAGKLDMVFVADGNAVRWVDSPAYFEANGPSDRPATFEPLTLYGAISQHTKHIGLLATATTTYEEPYLVARRFASLDHLSSGRVGWNVVTGSFPGDSKNFSREEHPEKAARYERANEFVDVCKGLWDSWAADAFLEDKATGRFLDAARVHVLDHRGEYFSVRGPLNVARSPQGYPVLCVAGQSEAGRELAAKHADVVFSVSTNLSDSQEFYADIKGRLAAYDRSPDTLKILPGCTVYVGREEGEAEAFYDELQGLITPALGVPYLSRLLQTDLSEFAVDGPLPDLPEETNAIASFRDEILRMAQRDHLTIRETYERVLPARGHVIFKGTASQVADEMQAWYEAGGADGFMVGMAVQPSGLRDFIELVVPELQRRGLFRTDYEGRTLREHLGLPLPKNQFFDAEALARR